MPAAIDIKGQRFGMLVAESRLPNGKWLCRCDCGNTKEVTAGKLREGKIRSCGCLQPQKRPDDLTGMRFGRLVAVEKVTSCGKNNEKWLCRCDCGNETIAYRSNLFKGFKTSCGCYVVESSTENLKLLEGTCLVNLRNKISKLNKSGVVGVCYDKSRGKWMAKITFRKRATFLGYFTNMEDAVKARKKAEEEREIQLKEILIREEERHEQG